MPNISGVGSYGDFRPISRYISETVQDRDIVTMELVCALSIGAISSDLE